MNLVNVLLTYRLGRERPILLSVRRESCIKAPAMVGGKLMKLVKKSTLDWFHVLYNMYWIRLQ